MSVQAIYNAIIEFDDEEIVKAIQDAMDAGVDSKVILNDGLISAMDEVGSLFSKGELYVP